MEASQNGDTPKSSSRFSIGTHGDLGMLHFKKLHILLYDCVTVVTSQVYPMVRDIFPLDNSCSADPMTLPTIALQQTSMIMEGSKI